MPVGDVKVFAVTADTAFSSPNNRHASPCLHASPCPCWVMTQAETVIGITRDYKYSPVPLQYGSGEAVTVLRVTIYCANRNTT